MSLRPRVLCFRPWSCAVGNSHVVETISFPEAALRKRVSVPECELCSLNFVVLAPAQWNRVYYFYRFDNKQLLVEVFVISGII